MDINTARIKLEQGCDLEEKGEYRQAFKLYLMAAKHGSVEAQVNLANLYDDGRGCRRNLQKAIYWYKKAIMLGSSEAAYNLGVHYLHLSNKRWAKYWLMRASDLGDEDARIEMEGI